MAKEVAIGKRLKISKAQQNMLLAVLGASIVLGVGLVFSIWLIKYISFNMKVISAKDVAISEYSEVIKVTGACKSPAGSSYTEAELRDCDPNNNPSSEEGTLRYKILVEMARNSDLDSVARESTQICYSTDGESKEKMSYEYIYKKYEESEDEEQRDKWLDILRTCSALRVIPDALPSSENTEALLASLNQLFLLSGWEPETLAPGKNNEIGEGLLIEGLNSIPVSLSIKTSSRMTLKILSTIEKSIREFAIDTATVKWNSETTLELEANAAAYYIEPIQIEEMSKEVKASNKKRSSD